MRAVLCNAFEGIKALSLAEAAEPELAADEVLIDVHAASVSYMDYLMIPIVNFSEAQDAVRRSPYDQDRHPLPMCFVCGPARVHGDGLRIIPGALPPRPDYKTGTFAAPRVPYPNLTGEDGAVAGEFVWAALDCPTGFAGVGAQHLGMTGAETILLGRMSARIERRPYPGDQCIIVAWPTGRDGRKLLQTAHY